MAKQWLDACANASFPVCGNGEGAEDAPHEQGLIIGIVDLGKAAVRSGLLDARITPGELQSREKER